MSNVIVIIVFILFFILNTLQEKKFVKKGLEVKGKLPINKKLFVIGKISILLTWLSAFLQAAGVPLRMVSIYDILINFAALIFLFGFIILVASYYYLGEANKTGLPEQNTILRTQGLYKFSRNPLYLGLYIMNIGAVLYTMNVLVLIIGVAGIIVHHLIVIEEEKFLQNRFGNDYINYKNNVRRYL